MAWAKRQFPHGVPDTILCNEMMSTWEMDDESGARYRAYVIDMARKLDVTYRKRAVVATRYAVPAAASLDFGGYVLAIEARGEETCLCVRLPRAALSAR